MIPEEEVVEFWVVFDGVEPEVFDAGFYLVWLEAEFRLVWFPLLF